MRVVSVVGNRPQFVKSAPLSIALRKAGIDEVAVHTGQHWDRALSQVFFDELAIPEPAYRLDLRTADPGSMEPAIRDVIGRERPDWVLVYGDTNSTLAGARAAGDTPVAHVEAGLRSFDLGMPEERNRIEVDRLAALLLCPDDRSAAQLAHEGVAGRREVVGDVMRDALDLFAPLSERSDEPFPDEYAVLTLHRAANTEPDRLRRIVPALGSTGWTFVFPVHPRTRHVLDVHAIPLPPNVQMVEPLGYLEMLALVRGSARVLTDSGGLQKEAYWLRIPCITLRPGTEWVETVETGANTLVDPDDDVALDGLGATLERARFPEGAPTLYGDGRAAERVAAALYA